MRLIDADALADALYDKHKTYPQWVADTIGSMPDAVIRCKDCKHRQDILCPKFGDGIWDYTTDDWFCADGKRRTDDG